MSRPSRLDGLVESLRDDAPRLDEVTQARMERELIVRAGVPKRRSRAVVFAAGLAVGALAAGLGVHALGSSEAAPSPPGASPVVALAPAPVEAGETASDSGPIAFETLRDGVPVRRGHFGDGESVQTSSGELLRVRFGGTGAATSLVEVAPESRVHFVRSMGDDLELSLERGRVRIEFHPQRRGEEHLAVRTPHGRVEVVGTAFEVRLGDEGTEVVVDEGTVRLVGPGHEPRLVSHGERAWLRAAESSGSSARAILEATRAGAAPEPQPEADAESGADAVPGPSAAAPLASASARAGSREQVRLDEELRFELADRYFAQGRFDDARHELYGVARAATSRAVRARAWVHVAEAFARESNPTRAAEAYRRAAQVGRGTANGDAALFALARLLADERDADGSRAAYLRYLEAAPAGPLAGEAARALCRLGVPDHCD